jgi:hypothetical protein
MNTPESIRALRRANPSSRPGFAGAVEETAEAVRARIFTSEPEPASPASGRARRRLVGLSAAGASAGVAAVVVALLAVGPPGGSPVVENAAGAVERAATLTAASAERSGTAVVRITHNGEPWAGTTIRWHGENLAVSSDAPRRLSRPGSGLLVVDGMMYGVEDGRWVELGRPESVDPGSGTTPDEYLAAVREDVGGTTLRRIVDGMTGLTTGRLDDGSTVYRGAVQAGLIARESGFKEGAPIRVLPFGFVAHDEAVDPAASIRVAVAVGPEGIVRGLTATWGPAWKYSVAYERLGTTPAPVAPANARPLRRGR